MVLERLEALVRIPAESGVTLEGMLRVPRGAQGVVVFAHGSGSGRLSPRNNYVAKALNDAGVGSFLLDLLTQEEDAVYQTRFDIDLLTQRLLAAHRWVRANPDTKHLRVGLFGASTGAAAALRAAAQEGRAIGAVVSRGGRPDLAGPEALSAVEAPTLLIVGGRDEGVIELNEQAYAQLRGEKELLIIPGATHLFEERGALEEVAHEAARWFKGRLHA